MLGINELAATTTTKSSGFNPTTLILILVVVVAFYLLMIRPRQKRQQQAQQQQNTLLPGARVQTTAGMYATVVDVDGDDVILEVAPGVEVRYLKRAILHVLSPGDAPDEDEAPADEADTEYETVQHDADEPAAPAGSVNPVEADAEESAYEQATGTKKD